MTREQLGTGHTAQGREWSIGAGTPDSENYPKNDRYQWQEFAGLAIEYGGYNDITAINPYSGERFWLADAFRCDAHSLELNTAVPGDEAIAVMQRSGSCGDCNVSPLDAIRRLLDAIEEAGWGRDKPGDAPTV